MNNRLKERREALGLTQVTVSEALMEIEPRAGVGMVSRYENGVCLPTKAQMEVLERELNMSRSELYTMDDLDLMGVLPVCEKPTEASEVGDRTEPPSHRGRVRKCYRISQKFAAALPDDLLEVCGYSSWQSWHDAALKRLLGEYAARKKGMDRKEISA